MMARVLATVVEPEAAAVRRLAHAADAEVDAALAVHALQAWADDW